MADVRGSLFWDSSGGRAVIDESIEVVDPTAILPRIMIDNSLAIEVLCVAVPGPLAQDYGHLRRLRLQRAEGFPRNVSGDVAAVGRGQIFVAGVRERDFDRDRSRWRYGVGLSPQRTVMQKRRGHASQDYRRDVSRFGD